MSVKAMGKVWDMDLPPNEKLVLLALADHADHAGENAYPGEETLAAKTGYDQRNVRRVLRSLEGKKIITKTHKGGGKNNPDCYSINNLKPDNLSANQNEETGQFVRHIPDKLSAKSKKITGQIKQGLPDKSRRVYENKPDKSCNPPTPPYKENHDLFSEPSREPSITGAVAPALKPYDLFAAFSEGYERHYGLPYKPGKDDRKADFGQIETLINQYGEKLSLEDWAARAVVNYFATPQASHTVKDLATRYAVFRRSALDRYSKPVAHSPPNGKAANSAGDVTRATMEKVGKDLGILK